jgi:hypothetical protein
MNSCVPNSVHKRLDTGANESCACILRALPDVAEIGVLKERSAFGEDASLMACHRQNSKIEYLKIRKAAYVNKNRRSYEPDHISTVYG